MRKDKRGSGERKLERECESRKREIGRQLGRGGVEEKESAKRRAARIKKLFCGEPFRGAKLNSTAC